MRVRKQVNLFSDCAKIELLSLFSVNVVTIRSLFYQNKGTVCIGLTCGHTAGVLKDCRTICIRGVQLDQRLTLKLAYTTPP